MFQEFNTVIDAEKSEHDRRIEVTRQSASILHEILFELRCTTRNFVGERGYKLDIEARHYAGDFNTPYLEIRYPYQCAIKVTADTYKPGITIEYRNRHHYSADKLSEAKKWLAQLIINQTDPRSLGVEK